MMDRLGRTWHHLRRIVQNLLLASVEAFLAVLVILVGIPILIAPNTLSPTSIATLLPLWGTYLWAACLILGGLLTLLGIAFWAIRLERAGVFLLGVVAAVFGMSILLTVGPGAFIGIVTYFAFALAMFSRYWFLGRMMSIADDVRNRILEKESS